LLFFSELDHALKNLAMLGKEEILGADFFDRGVQRVIVEDDCAKDAALGFQIMGKRAFEGSFVCHDSLFIRPPLFSLKEFASARGPAWRFRLKIN
jgi:hypothetical protein